MAGCRRLLGLWVYLLGRDTHKRTVNVARPPGEPRPLFAPVTATLEQQKMCDEQAV